MAKDATDSSANQDERFQAFSSSDVLSKSKISEQFRQHYWKQEEGKMKTIPSETNLTELSVGLIAVAFAIRDSFLDISYTRLCDLAIMYHPIRAHLYDLALLPKEDELLSIVNPTSRLLVQALAELQTDVLKIDEKKSDAQNKAIYQINESMRPIYKQLPFGRQVYEDTIETIKFYREMYKNEWDNELTATEKSIAEEGNTVYRFGLSGTASNYVKKILNIATPLENFLFPTKIGTLLVEYADEKRLLKKAERLRWKYFFEQHAEDFIEERILTKSNVPINITGYCMSVDQQPTTGRNKIELMLYLSYKSFRVLTYLDGYEKEVDPENLRNHRIQVIGIPQKKINGEPVIIALLIKEQQKCRFIDNTEDY